MSNKMSNFPGGQLANLDGSAQTGETITCLRQLAQQGKPTTIQELDERLDSYFQFCGEHDFRCGIESLCLSLSISRQTLLNWSRGDGCSPEWQERIVQAKQFVIAFLEELTLKGRLNPASSIFYLKNWAGYRDVQTIEDGKSIENSPAVSREEIIRRAQFFDDLSQSVDELPD